MLSNTEHSDKPFSTQEASQSGQKFGEESLTRPPRKPPMPPVFHPITGEKLPAGYTLAAETNRVSVGRFICLKGPQVQLAAGQGYAPEDYDIIGPDGERYSCKDFVIEKKQN
ncbi:hypothetical protein E5D57_012804 [Metarhizium anisopliae]|nr:hypothetical protein E5D57_012804 [Metarhizium anisopliae]